MDTSTKKDLRTMWQAKREINEKITEFKVALHTVDKWGFNVEEIEKQLDELGIEYVKLSKLVDDKVAMLMKKDGR